MPCGRVLRLLVGGAPVLAVAGAPARVAGPASVEGSRYLVEVLGVCGNCHIPKGPAGDRPGMRLAGEVPLDLDFGTFIAPSITPDPETGLGRWRDGEILAAIHGARRGGGGALPPVRHHQVPAPAPPKPR